MIGPNGEKRPADVIANAVLAAKIATGEVEEEHVDAAKRRGGKVGGNARASSMTPERRREVARKAAAARWYDNADERDE